MGALCDQIDDRESSSGYSASKLVDASHQPGLRRPVLTRREVLLTALEIIEVEGVDALSMRRLGKAVNRSAMAVYRYTANKEALVDEVIGLVFTEFVVPSGWGPERSWEIELRRVAHEFQHMSVAHRNVMSLVVGRSLAAPIGDRRSSGLQFVEEMTALFVEGGFDERRAFRAARLFMGFVCGCLLYELQEATDVDGGTGSESGLDVHRPPMAQLLRDRSPDCVLHTDSESDEFDTQVTNMLADLRMLRDQGLPGVVA